MAEKFLLQGKEVVTEYYCTRARSTSISTFMFIGVGRLCAWTDLLCLGVNQTLNSVLLPISTRWLANIRWYLTRSCAIRYFSLLLSCELSQLNREKNAWGCSTDVLGSGFCCDLSLTVFSYLRFSSVLRVSGSVYVPGVEYHLSYSLYMGRWNS